MDSLENHFNFPVLASSGCTCSRPARNYRTGDKWQPYNAGPYTPWPFRADGAAAGNAEGLVEYVRGGPQGFGFNAPVKDASGRTIANLPLLPATVGRFDRGQRELRRSHRHSGRPGIYRSNQGRFLGSAPFDSKTGKELWIAAALYFTLQYRLRTRARAANNTSPSLHRVEVQRMALLETANR